MKIQWKKTCFACRVPLDIDVHFDDGGEERLFADFMEFFPPLRNLEMNVSGMRRFNDGKFHPLCKWCFDNHKKVWFDPIMLREREIGRRVHKFGPPHPVGATRDDIETYFVNARRYFAARRRHGETL